MTPNTADGQRQVTLERSFWFHTLLRITVRPWLWFTALRQLTRIARPGWWRRPPFLPVPDRGYLAFRMQTAYGTNGEPKPEEVVDYLAWVRRSSR